MRLLLSLLIIGLTGLNAHGQPGEGKAFIYTLFDQSAAITYYKKLWEGHITQFEKTLTQDTLYDVSMISDPSKWLVLTQDERQYIQSELKRQTSMVWTKELFPNGKMIASSAGGNGFHVNYDKEYSFSQPIFIRNGAYFIFYSGYSCGVDCGNGEWGLYRKEKNTWVRWLILDGWIS